MTTTLLTGASGFIGRAVLDRLREAGEPVMAVSSKPREDEPGVTWLRADALDAAAMIRMVREVQPTRVLHLAWECGRYDEPIHLRWLSASLDWLAVLPEVGCRQVLTAGSSMEYRWGPLPCVEVGTPLEPNTLYGEAKLALGRLAGAIFSRAGVAHVHPRIFFVCGPGQPEGKLLSGAIHAVMDGRSFRCNAGNAWRDYLDVADVARVLVALLSRGATGPINVGSGHAVRLGDMVGAVGETLGRPELIELGPSLKDSANDRAEADVAHLRQVLGEAPGFDPHRAIARIIAAMNNTTVTGDHS